MNFRIVFESMIALQSSGFSLASPAGEIQALFVLRTSHRFSRMLRRTVIQEQISVSAAVERVQLPEGSYF
ncbi:hypothetical protein ACRPM7_20660 [Burkholderia vietnamiensis]|uniref:hypothetical protein n=1 Tax=Burkholderia vietnamiensis TaxID=60552 RepID=UPI000757ED07|nr:hypothetical protein [Burkholderia vietnamiensis]KVF31834.1 hypothetical protein WJ09_18440 [Burkholderia vietnamiensis]MDN8115612.1 hypothetical protein [Burkholderia vietnamiensis]QTK86434.1 hypothetical protein J4D21_21875 [Burkholderia vietnamiensis]HDR9140962.1 hypothetical protein [Burkholderia vietnamiensis]HDR9317230.1 hypothetical protein [Burkholderia vietnamiensis]